jgi:hypothetical protein
MEAEDSYLNSDIFILEEEVQIVVTGDSADHKEVWT